MLLKLENVTYVYQKGSPYESTALHDVSFSVTEKDFVALIGHTGSGKSTLAQHLNGLLKPTEGSVTLDGNDIHSGKTALRDVRKRIGLVFQYPEHQLFEETVYKDVAFGPKNAGLSQAETDERVTWALRQTGLDPAAVSGLSPFELSGGNMRRAALAGVLAMRPEMLVLDEPAAGLDPMGRAEMMRLVGRLYEEGCGIVMITHSMDDVAEWAKRAVVMSHGTIIRDEAPRSLFAGPKELLQAGLDVPQTVQMGMKLRETGVPFPEQAISRQETLDALTAILSAHKGAEVNAE